MTDQQHKDLLRLQATLEFLTVNVVTRLSAVATVDSAHIAAMLPQVQTGIDNIYRAKCEERGLAWANEKKA